jgi:5'-nucleotidase
MVLAVLLVLALAFPAWSWEITVAFTNDLHAYADRLRAFASILAQADLVLDAGDTWEDTVRRTGAQEAWATLRAMAEIGYDAMVLGNHETYLEPRLLAELVAAAPFPVLATNLRSNLPTKEWALREVRGVRVLILGVLWDLALIWPGWELRDPLESIRQALAAAPAHDVFILLAHLDLSRIVTLAQALPGCALIISGHNHLFLAEPVWVGSVPIVQAGARGEAVGVATLTEHGLASYSLVWRPVPAATGLPSPWKVGANPVSVTLTASVLRSEGGR